MKCCYSNEVDAKTTTTTKKERKCGSCKHECQRRRCYQITGNSVYTNEITMATNHITATMMIKNQMKKLKELCKYQKCVRQCEHLNMGRWSRGGGWTRLVCTSHTHPNKYWKRQYRRTARRENGNKQHKCEVATIQMNLREIRLTDVIVIR